ncbi:Zn-ribbon domain-containing OB-fold protein [Candidatus Bathyarchaeota archaeon]|nr:MAG: Zn-ribbon domain-containing OB-fold protein [Candidatus Bathyarchaeota archaeon]TMI46647.1 MAG: Zn-ribbon domain-containing OB-fold protein [Candidatus Bathyarchaeota archaeon]
MPILEKLAQPGQARHWTDSIPLEFHYTAGVAGEEFRRELRDNGRFLVSKCSKCKSTYIPARMYCPSCFIEMKDQFPIDKPGYVYSFTSVNRDRSGVDTELPVTVGLVKFEGIKGGIVHLLDVDDLDGVSIGMKVTPSLKNSSERTGAITDILAFKLVSTGPSKVTADDGTVERQAEGTRDDQAKSLLHSIEESGYPIEEDEMTISALRNKIGKGELLTREEDRLLHRLGDKAREWRKAVKSSAETEPTDTLSG